MNLRQQGEFTNDLFAEAQPVGTEPMMGLLDEINERWGRGTLRAASVPADSDSAMRQEMMSRSSKTNVD